MARVKIATPVEDHNGVVGNVYITQGVGFADTETHAAEIAYCRANGYTVTELDPDEEAADESDFLAEDEVNDDEADDEEDADETDDRLPRRNGSAEAWRAYAVAHGMSADEAEQLTRDQLVERFTSSTEESDS